MKLFNQSMALIAGQSSHLRKMISSCQPTELSQEKTTLNNQHSYVLEGCTGWKLFMLWFNMSEWPTVRSYIKCIKGAIPQLWQQDRHRDSYFYYRSWLKDCFINSIESWLLDKTYFKAFFFSLCVRKASQGGRTKLNFNNYVVSNKKK